MTAVSLGVVGDLSSQDRQEQLHLDLQDAQVGYTRWEQVLRLEWPTYLGKRTGQQLG